jgi:hypothetical protein
VDKDQEIGSPEVAEADIAKAAEPNGLLVGLLVIVTVCASEGVIKLALTAGRDEPTALFATTWIL